MSDSTKNFLAVFLGSSDQPAMAKWNALPEAERQQRNKAGSDAWHAWVAKYNDAIVVMGSPLGKTKAASKKGIADTRNALCGYTVIKANSHEDAVKMFAEHPHFTIFPGESVEVMECLPIPSAA